MLRTGALSVSTQGSAGGSDGVRGYAQVANVDVAAGVVTGDLVRSRCTGSAGGLSGAATLTNVRVGGQPVAANPARNTVVRVGDAARVTLNEQIASAGSITVNAVHVQLLRGNAGDVVLPQAHCDVTAPPVVPDQTPLALLLPLTTMAVLMGLVIVVWRADPGLFRDGAW